MNKSIFLSIYCALCALTATAQTYSGGSGTEIDPYLISSKADMEALATAVNSGNNYSGRYFLLTQDITDAVTTVIGDYNNPFKGIFNGNNHKIRLNVSNGVICSYGSSTSKVDASYAGVFGKIDNAIIKNLGVNGTISISYGWNSYTTLVSAGGICGESSNSIITNCYNQASISATSSNGFNSGFAGTYVGGICGRDIAGEISSCYNEGNIAASGSTSNGANTFSGGICGFSSGSISGCLSFNNTTKASNNTNFGADAKRIVAWGNTNISKCYALSSILLNGTAVNSEDATSQNGKDWSNVNVFHTCTFTEFTLIIPNINTLKWQRSSDNGNNWIDIACTDWIYTEPNPTAGHYIYRAQNGDGTYSPYVEVTYSDAVPATINTLPLTDATKTVDESMSFSLELTDDNYSYQWYRNNAVIDGATGDTYSIPVVKSANAGVYFCRVWNGCNSVNSETTTLTVNKCPQVISFPEIPAKIYGDDAITLPEKTDKGLTITYQSVNTNVATVAGNVLTIVNPGASNIIASQAGDADYLMASSVERTLTVNKQAQAITFGAIDSKRYGDPAFNLPATTDKGLTISYQAINTNVATVDGNTVTIHNSGTTDIIASQVGDDYRYAATPVSQTLTVQKANQSITFANFDTKIYGDPDIELSQYSDAGLEITYTSDNEDVATINGNTVVLHNTGSAQITATQNGNSNYNAAPTITRTLVIGKAGQTIVWNNIEPKTYGDDDFYLPVSTDKGLTIAYSVANENVATVTGNKVHITGAGTTNITASQVGNNNYFPTSSVTLALTVSKALQTITFNELADKTYGDPAFTLQANVNSNLPVTFESSNTNVATVSGNTLTIVNAGTAYITASVAGNDNYYMANPVQQQLTVNKATQTIALDIIPNKTYGDAAFALNALVNTGLSVTYTSSDPSKLLISGNQAIIFGAGSFTVTATQSGNNNYLPVSDSKMFVVNKANLTVLADNKERSYGDENPALTYTFDGFVNGDSKVDLQTLPVIICTAEQISPVGSYPINISDASDNNYNFIYQNAQLTVNKASLTVQPNDANRKYGESNPTFVLAYSGFKNGESESILSEKPLAVTNAKATSDTGIYDIFVSGGSANNYDFVYQTGKLTVDKALLNVIVDNKQREYGDANPQFTYSFTGFKNDDTLNDIDALPSVLCNASLTSPVGEYNITAQTASDNNYEFTYFNGKLTIVKAPLTITAENKQRGQGEENPPFTLLYSGFKNNENESVLDVLPTISCNANINSLVGFYDIILSGGSDNNYDYTLINGKLEITTLTGLSKINVSKISVYPNPVKNYLFIHSESPIEKVEIYNQAGICVLINDNSPEKINVSRLTDGLYLARIYIDGTSLTRKIIIKKH